MYVCLYVCMYLSIYFIPLKTPKSVYNYVNDYEIMLWLHNQLPKINPFGIFYDQNLSIINSLIKKVLKEKMTR